MDDLKQQLNEIRSDESLFVTLEKKLRLSPWLLSLWKFLLGLIVIPVFFYVSEGEVTPESIFFYHDLNGPLDYIPFIFLAVVPMSFWTSITSVPIHYDSNILDSKFKHGFWKRQVETFYSVSISWFVVQLFCLVATKHHEEEEIAFGFFTSYFYYFLIIFGFYSIVYTISNKVLKKTYNPFENRVEINVDFNDLKSEIVLNNETNDFVSIRIGEVKYFMSRSNDLYTSKNIDIFNYKDVVLDIAFDRDKNQYVFIIKNNSDELLDIVKSASYSEIKPDPKVSQ